MIRLYNGWTKAAPYESIKVADIGDINVNLFDLKDTCKKIREAYRKIVATGCIPLTLGDKSLSICRNTQISFESTVNMLLLHFSWISRRWSHDCISNSSSRCWEVGANTRDVPPKFAVRAHIYSEMLLFLLFRHGPVGLIHVDAHADTSDMILGEKIGHGTPFRRCVDEGLLDCKRVVQIGLRGSGYSPDNYEWSRAQVSWCFISNHALCR